MSDKELRDDIIADDRYSIALTALLKEGMVTKTKGRLHLTK